MTDLRIKRALEQCITGGECRFMSYKRFSEQFGFGPFPPVWANRKILDEVALACRNDPPIGLDLTYLLSNSETHYPSVIEGEPFNKDRPGPQIRKARENAQKIIDKFGPGTRNPY